MRRTFPIIAALFLFTSASAEVTSAADNGFTTVSEAIIDANPSTVFLAAVTVGEWWHPSHTISGDASRMSIDPRPQGCFCETLGDGEGIVHLTVTFAKPSALLRMTGGLGPLGLMGVNGNMLWEFEAEGDQTKVRFSYAVGGYSPDGLDKIAPAVDFVIGEALQRLRLYVETGNPEPPGE